MSRVKNNTKRKQQSTKKLKKRMDSEMSFDSYYSNLVLDKKGKLISKKKRVNDTKIINSLLSCKSNLKLNLKEYRFLKQTQAIEQISEKQRTWLTFLSNKQKNTI
tara:strand:- start:6 stop:320 length:315 start_codon:yes stop_codon:yes gene_type:complete